MASILSRLGAPLQNSTVAYSVSGVRDVHNGLRVTTTSAGREMPRRAA